jgi:hypothetical protein
VRRAEIEVSLHVKTRNIIEQIQAKGYELDPEMDPTITFTDFDGIKEIDLEQSVEENKLRDYDMLNAVGFKGGYVYVTIRTK